MALAERGEERNPRTLSRKQGIMIKIVENDRLTLSSGRIWCPTAKLLLTDFDRSGASAIDRYVDPHRAGH